jgi:hypothetical protein
MSQALAYVLGALPKIIGFAHSDHHQIIEAQSKADGMPPFTRPILPWSGARSTAMCGLCYDPMLKSKFADAK